MQPILLYDIPSNLADSESQYWSPNTLKTRLVLSYKGLPFETSWVEYPDIEDVIRTAGAGPTMKHPDGSPKYTVPAIMDPNTNTFLCDSWAIAEYLDETYPEKPVLPPNSRTLISAFEAAFVAASRSYAVPIIMVRTAERILNPRSAHYMRTTKAATFGLKTWEEMVGDASTNEAWWMTFKNGMSEIDGWYRKGGGKWVMGDTFSFADVIIGGRLFWYKRVLEEEEWKKMSTWDDGRWARRLEDIMQECHL
ncbi:hypothetical protein HYDPIDRAFT_172806 [Hydnomerulius pinastri MD-312]|nr:hypothetical protein HYDPIDRAFT_172806 [Hydnomerulius pinastri MD-312]